jgi:adenylate cyclase
VGWAPVTIAAVGATYVVMTGWVYVAWRYWMPVVTPLVGGLLVPHVCLLSARLLAEQRSKRHIRSVFSRVVSPEVVSELLKAEELALGGARRQVTVMFADVRGFTEMTETNHARAEDFVKTHQLAAEVAEAHVDAQARETLATVNLYLATVAETIKRHRGTLDKYIGDCVMAFWGAPTPNPRHAVDCVRAAIDAQKAIHTLNQARAAENRRRAAAESVEPGGHSVSSFLPIMECGTGINTGEMIVGLMGSERHLFNYTVFGREVNLASRLEGVSGRGRIIISESTLRELQRHEPDLAARCGELPEVAVKGIRGMVRIYEVRWKAEASAPASLASAHEKRAS